MFAYKLRISEVGNEPVREFFLAITFKYVLEMAGLIYFDTFVVFVVGVEIETSDDESIVPFAAADNVGDDGTLSFCDTVSGTFDRFPKFATITLHIIMLCR